MWLLYAEAFGAMLILILIVWWTMFHGRHKGERDRVAPPVEVADRLEMETVEKTTVERREGG